MADEPTEDIVDEEVEVQWKEDGHDDDKDAAIIYLAHLEAASIEPALSNNEFLHGINFPVDMPAALAAIGKVQVPTRPAF